jgi:hypothetical protein
MGQTNFWVPQGEEWMDAEIHRIAKHYQADHPTLSMLGALYEVLAADARQFSISMERIPADRRAGASYLRDEKRKQSGTSQGHKTQANSAVTPLKPQAD